MELSNFFIAAKVFQAIKLNEIMHKLLLHILLLQHCQENISTFHYLALNNYYLHPALRGNTQSAFRCSSLQTLTITPW